VIRNITGADPKFAEAYGRSLAGGPIPKGSFKQKIPFLGAAGKESEMFIFAGGKNRLQSAYRFVSGYGTSLIERFNQLARAPFEMPILKDILPKIPLVRSLRFDVDPSSGLKTFGKLTAKLGIAAPLMYTAYQELDHAARNSTLLDGTIFSEGITAGIGHAATMVQKGVSTIAEITGGHALREWQEDSAPGSTNLGSLIAFPTIGAVGGLFYGYGRRLGKQTMLQAQAGLSLSQASAHISAESSFFKKALYGTAVSEEILAPLEKNTIEMLERETANKMKSRTGRFAAKIASIQKGKGALNKAMRVFGEMSPAKIPSLVGATIGAALILPFLPGALVPEKRPNELEKLYSGQQLVPVRKGRWWEFGRSPYEGGRIDRYEQHWLPSLIANAKEKSIYGEDAPSPMRRWFIENFTYDLERKHYYDRPYPLTGAAFEDVPFVGPVLAATVGKLFKPAVYMHTSEWQSGNKGGGTLYGKGGPIPEGEVGGAVLSMPPKFGYQPFPKELGGELEAGVPISPYGVKGTSGESVYRMTEMVGLPGFTATSVKEAITGTSDLFDEESQLESARRMYGAEREYWDKEIGGGLMTTEMLRRLYPHRRRQIEQYNPLRNTMPDWLPGPSERSPDFLHGDPYTKVAKGEERLPGVGYAALHPWLKDVAPEDYPAIERLSILADVAPYSDRFKETLHQVRGMSTSGRLSKEDQARLKDILAMNKEKKKRKNFSPYLYRDRDTTPMEAILARENEEIKNKGAKKGLFAKILGSYWETIAHNAETPFEFLTPMAPGAKLIHKRTAVEDYKKFQVFGTDSAFWQHPVRDFIKPFFNVLRGSLGSSTPPKEVEERRSLEEYFDILKYVKNTRLKEQAIKANDSEAVAIAEQQRRETLFGINPFTQDFTKIYRSQPRRERDYFEEFVGADMAERKEILKMIPKNEKALMMARWRIKDASDARKAQEKGLLSEKEAAEVDVTLRQLYEDKDTEGMPKTKELWSEFLSTRHPGESYPDWYRRTKLLIEGLKGKGLPGPNWVGWHPAVDLEDIKLKVVQDAAKNMYDYDLWPDKARLVTRRPAIEAAAEELQEAQGQSESEIRANIDRILAASGVKNANIFISPSVKNNLDISFKADRREDARKILHGGMRNG